MNGRISKRAFVMVTLMLIVGIPTLVSPAGWGPHATELQPAAQKIVKQPVAAS